MHTRDESVAQAMERSEIGTPEMAEGLIEVIAARRKYIRDQAECAHCGATLAACEAERGKDPTAPPWFGCCAHGTSMGPCSHRSSTTALNVLLDEIAVGRVRPVEDLIAEREERDARRAALTASWTTPDGQAVTTVGDMLRQGKWWRRKNGSWIKVSDMSPGHRYNTAALVMRAAWRYALALAMDAIYSAVSHDGGDMAQDCLDRDAAEAQHYAMHEPQTPIRRSALYRALTDGLAIQGDGTEPWQKTGRDPVTGEPCEVPPPMGRVGPLDDLGCSGEAHA